MKRFTFHLGFLSTCFILSGAFPVFAQGNPGTLIRIQGAEIPGSEPGFEMDDADQGSFEAGSREGLKAALVRQLERCQDAKAVWNFAGKKITQKRWCTDTANWFLSKLKTVNSLNELLTLARTELEWYRSTGKPDSGEVQFTGYFNPIHRAKAKREGVYQYPIYRLPPDIQRPYFTREQIEKGALAGKGLELAWLDNPVDPFIMQVQGSGTILMDQGDGKEVRLNINYAGENGHPYVSLGKVMRAAGVPEEYISLQGIRKYFLEVHPEEWVKFSNQNPSYVFFKQDADGPYGYSGAILTPKHSIAVDKAVFPMGAIGLIRTERPSVVSGDQAVAWKQFSQFIVAQDTGGAIKTPGRVDVYWGEGAYAEVAAGRTDRLGSLYFMLVPANKKKFSSGSRVARVRRSGRH